MPGAYVLTTMSGAMLYVGLASKLGVRFLQHLEDPSKRANTVDGRAAMFHWLVWEEPAKLERAWLNAHLCAEARLPILNRNNSPVST